MKIKLHWKLTILFCSSIIIALLVGFLFLSSHLKSSLDQNLEANLKRELELGRYLLEGHSKDRGSLEDADSIAHRIGQVLGVRATIIGGNGEVIGDSELTPNEAKMLENHAGRPEFRDALNKGFGESRRYSYTLKKYLLYVAVPFGGGQPAGVLRLAMPLTEVELFESRFLNLAVLTLLIVFLFSLGFTFLISVYISRPLREMAGIAQAMAKGDFGRKPSVTSRDEMGDLANALNYMSDEIRSMIERLRQEGEKLDTVLSSMSEGVMVVDDKGTIVLMNPAMRKTFLIDIQPEGRRPAEVIRNTVILEIISRLLSGQDRLIKEVVELPTPEERVCQANGVSIVRDGKFRGAVLVVHDITELRRLEKIRQDFVANVSHELRTPVSSIKGYSETLLEGALEDKAQAREFVAIIQENSDRLANLINDLLDLSKIESGKMQMAFLPVDLAPVVQRCLSILEKTVEKKGLRITVDFPDKLPRVSGDEARLSQVFLNLLDNAVKYTPEGGSIRVSAQLQDRTVRVNVEDSGAGIPEKDLPRIFERFYRVDKARSRELGGTGLGLSIVKHIVNAHGGDVTVFSQQGQGSVFSFTIPIA